LEVEVVSDSQRRFAAWIGGSMFASLSTFDQVAITKQVRGWGWDGGEEITFSLASPSM
jgi:hypothetical protein